MHNVNGGSCDLSISSSPHFQPGQLIWLANYMQQLTSFQECIKTNQCGITVSILPVNRHRKFPAAIHFYASFNSNLWIVHSLATSAKWSTLCHKTYTCRRYVSSCQGHTVIKFDILSHFLSIGNIFRRWTTLTLTRINAHSLPNWYTYTAIIYECLHYELRLCDNLPTMKKSSRAHTMFQSTYFFLLADNKPNNVANWCERFKAWAIRRKYLSNGIK